MSGRPTRTPAKRRKIAAEALRKFEERRELDQVLHGCYACSVGIHDPAYGDDGVAHCRCCNRNMTDDGYPHIELKQQEQVEPYLGKAKTST